MSATTGSSIRRTLGSWALQSQLAIRQNARYDARQSPPRPHDDTPAPTEARIVERHTHKLASLDRARTRAFKTERVAAISSQLTGEPAACTDIVNHTRAKIYTDFLAFTPIWRAAVETIDARAKDLRDFKRDNLLTRDANSPDAWLGLIGLLFVFAVETIGNGFFLADVDEAGLLGGTSLAAILCIPTLMAGLAAGFIGLRAQQHARPAVRAFGISVVALAVLFECFWALYVGQVRLYAAAHATSDATVVTDWTGLLDNLREAPLAPFDSPQALALMALSLAAFVLALFDGFYTLSDRYPGFTRVDRQWHQAIADAQFRKAQFYKQLDRRVSAATSLVNGRRTVIDRKTKRALLILDNARDTAIDYDQRAADLLFVHHQCLVGYQELNARHRSDDAIPTRFRSAQFPGTQHVLPQIDWDEAKRKIHLARCDALAAAARAIQTIEALRYEIINKLEAGSSTVITALTPILPAPQPQSAEAA